MHKLDWEFADASHCTPKLNTWMIACGDQFHLIWWQVVFFPLSIPSLPFFYSLSILSSFSRLPRMPDTLDYCYYITNCSDKYKPILWRSFFFMFDFDNRAKLIWHAQKTHTFLLQKRRPSPFQSERHTISVRGKMAMLWWCDLKLLISLEKKQSGCYKNSHYYLALGAKPLMAAFTEV